MTTPAYALAVDEHLPTDESAEAAGELRIVLSELFSGEVKSPSLTLRGAMALKNLFMWNPSCTNT